MSCKGERYAAVRRRCCGGGGLDNSEGGILTVENSAVTANEAQAFADDILNQGTLTLTRGTLGKCVDLEDGEGCPVPCGRPGAPPS